MNDDDVADKSGFMSQSHGSASGKMQCRSLQYTNNTANEAKIKALTQLSVPQSSRYLFAKTKVKCCKVLGNRRK